MNQFKVDRNQFFLALRSENIGVNVHYVPLYEHTFFKNFGFIQSDYPNSRYIYDRIITLPLWPDMSEYDINSVIEALKKVAKAYKRWRILSGLKLQKKLWEEPQLVGI